jgi:hypothetical protein
VLIGAAICCFSHASVTNWEVRLLGASWNALKLTSAQHCLVMEDNFKTLDKSIWNYEIQRGGF